MQSKDSDYKGIVKLSQSRPAEAEEDSSGEDALVSGIFGKGAKVRKNKDDDDDSDDAGDAASGQQQHKRESSARRHLPIPQLRLPRGN